jgi:mevalonate kinase
MAVTVSAPGRILCAGDHAQVIDEPTPTVSCAIDVRLRVRITPRNDRYIVIRSSEMQQKMSFEDIFTGHAETVFALNNGDRHVAVHQLVRKVFEDIVCITPTQGFTIEIDTDSELFLGAGLGSSTALLVSLAAGISKLLDQVQTPYSIATQVATVEADLYDVARPSDAHVIARGGFIRGDGNIAHESFHPSIVVGLKKPERNYGESIERAKEYQNKSPPVYNTAKKFATESANELWRAVIEENERKLAQSMIATGDSLEALRFDNAPLRAARARAMGQFEQVGVKQSGIGHRAVLIGIPIDNADPFRYAMHSISGKEFSTTVVDKGIKYNDDINASPSISSIKMIEQLTTYDTNITV